MNKPLTWVKDFTAIAVAVIALAAVFVRGGKLVEVLDQHTRILADHTQKLISIEEKGTQGLQKHEAVDDARVRTICEQMTRQQEATVEVTRCLSELRRDTSVALTKIDGLREMLEMHRQSSERNGTK